MIIESNGVRYWKSSKHIDQRGDFSKIFSYSLVKNVSKFEVLDCFISNSNKNVIRGMHLQIGEFASNRIIHVLKGKILDVLVDLRHLDASPLVTSRYLGPEEDFDAFFVPAGIAHGYEVLENSTVIYLSDKEYSKSHDKGINYNSINFNWLCNNPIVSDRDLNLPDFANFKI